MCYAASVVGVVLSLALGVAAAGAGGGWGGAALAIVPMILFACLGSEWEAARHEADLLRAENERLREGRRACCVTGTAVWTDAGGVDDSTTGGRP